MRVNHWLIALSLLPCFVAIAEAADHPSQGYQPREVHPQYGESNFGFDSDMNFGSITFAELPSKDALTDKEKYILAGTTDSKFGHPLEAWYSKVVRVAAAYWYKRHTLPAVLDEAAIMEAYGDNSLGVNQDLYAEMRNPVTGEFPTINAETFSAGNLYIHILTPAEVSHFAELVPLYHMHWSEGVDSNPITGEEKEIELASPIMYVRVYGETGVIQNHIMYSWRDQ
jgi:hypothetical protein